MFESIVNWYNGIYAFWADLISAHPILWVNIYAIMGWLSGVMIMVGIVAILLGTKEMRWEWLEKKLQKD